MGAWISGKSTAMVKKNILQGGEGKGGETGQGSVGLYVMNSSAEIRENEVFGGQGRTAANNRTGSIAVQLFSGEAGTFQPLLQDNLIDGGSGKHEQALLPINDKPGTGSAGVSLSATQNSSLKPKIVGNTIQGGTGMTNGGTSSVGLSGFQTSPEIVNNTIRGGSHQGPIAAVLAFGVNLVSSNTFKIQRNSILAAQGNYTNTRGVSINLGSAQSVLENNMIHGGLSTSGLATGYALTVENTQSLPIRFNTLVLPMAGSSAGLVHNKVNSAAATDTRIDNNLLVGSGGNATALLVDTCPGAIIGSFEGNGLVHLEGRAIATLTAVSFNKLCEGLSTSYPAVLPLSSFATLMENFCTGIGCVNVLKTNRDLMGTCANKGGFCREVPGCFDQKSCALALFQQWSSDDSGVSTLLAPDQKGWKLKSSLQCDIHQSDLPPTTGDDRYGEAVRTSPASRGAHEQDACVVLGGG
jgi:hypothetical protein